jgi:hypothetical protein
MMFCQVQSRTVAPDQESTMSFSGIDKTARHQHPTRPCPLAAGLCALANKPISKWSVRPFEISGGFAISACSSAVPILTAISEGGDSRARLHPPQLGQQSPKASIRVVCVCISTTNTHRNGAKPRPFIRLQLYAHCALALRLRSDCSTCGERCGGLSPLSCN